MKRFLTITLLSLYAGVALCLQEEGLLDDASLKNYLKRNFTADESMSWDERGAFKTNQKIPDEQLHRVLMEIYQEATEKRSSGLSGREEQNNNNRTIEGVLGWLPKCGDIPVKDFLMNYATTKENDSWLRRSAILSYLREANAEEAKDALLRFLVEEDRMSHMERLSLYEYARMTYDSASPESKAAILAALIASANNEEGKIEFMTVDKILAERSAAYRYSRERLAMLELHSLEAPTNNLYTDRDLKAALAESRKYKTYTSISTNLAVLKSREFTLPQPDLSTNDMRAAASDNMDKSNTGMAKQNLGVYVLLCLVAFLLLGFGIWKLRK